jgi:L-ascorbate metabolism protein UlaG (beta-lactamase superfamily)
MSAACSNDGATKLLYQGHASFRLIAKNGTVIYIDPYAGEGYDIPADIILVTHGHRDHNRIDLVTQNKGCVIVTYNEALSGGKHNTLNIKGINIEAVEASNANHNPSVCVGYIITIDGVRLYHAGDTSRTGQMESFAGKNLDYALLPCDGIYNMNAEDAAQCAAVIGAKHNVPMHTNPSKLFDREIAERFNAPNRLIIESAEEIELSRL